MRRLAINFATPGWRRALRRTPPVFGLLGAAGLVLAVVTTLQLKAESARQAVVRAEAAALQTRQAASEARAAQRTLPPLPEAKLRAINAVVTQLNLPWRAVLDALEAAGGPGVAVLEVNTDAPARLLRGTAEAATAAAMLAYIERLQQQPVVEVAQLSKHEVTTQTGADPIRFEFELRWREGPP